MNNWDLMLAKNFRRDALHVQFRTEFFNAFNHPSFNQPNRFLDATSFGTITSTLLENRQIRDLLRLRTQHSKLHYRRSQPAASVSRSCNRAPACDAFRLGNSITLPDPGTAKPGVARSFEKVSLVADGARSILMTSPRPIWPVAIKFEIG